MRRLNLVSICFGSWCRKANNVRTLTKTGHFITFEGGEGTGKSTQIKLLLNNLVRMGLNAVQTREPGGSLGAEAVRHVILTGAARHLGPAGEALLFSAARIDHIDQFIRPKLEQGNWVLCDRFADSTRAYQGVLGNFDARLIQSLEKVTLAGLYPDLTFILDLPAETGLERAHKRRGAGAHADRFEAESLDFHRALRLAFLDIASSEPNRCRVIDAGRDISTIADEILYHVCQRFDLATEANG